MAPRKYTGSTTTKRVVNKGAWAAEEDRRLAEYIEVHGAKRWKTVAIKSGLSRCGKSCRLRWLNYLRPNIKRGNITDDEEDLILRLHKLLGNRWSLIAGRLPGRTDNEIKNYWNSHLSKKMNQNQNEKIPEPSIEEQEITKLSRSSCEVTDNPEDNEAGTNQVDESMINFDDNELFDFSNESCYGLDWVNKLLELDADPWLY